MATRKFHNESLAAYGEMYSSQADNDPYIGGPTVVVGFAAGELDPNGFISYFSNHLTVETGGAGMYEIHFSVGASWGDPSTPPTDQFVVRLSLNGAQDCKLHANGGEATAATSGLFRLTEGDTVGMEIQTTGSPYLMNIHLWINRIGE